MKDADDSARPGIFSTTVVQLPAYRVRALARVMYGNAFEIVVIVIILANAAALAVLTYSDVDPTVALVATVIDRVAIVFYTVEVLLRIISYGSKPWMFFRNGWNIFDFLVVIAIPLLDASTVLFRLVRLLRILRIFRFLPEARILMLSMIKSVAPLANLAVLIGFLMFIYAMAGVYLFGEANPEQWGDVGAAMITLVVLLTLENFPDSFTSGLEITPFALLYFLSYMFFIVFTVLNVLIGIVLNAMDQAREEVAASLKTGLSDDEDSTALRAELDELRKQLDAVAGAGAASPDHIRRIREEIDALKRG
ncbi:hypothetical protein BH10ACT7_BH10ACT7_31640 [soil metagenome]